MDSTQSVLCSTEEVSSSTNLHDNGSHFTTFRSRPGIVLHATGDGFDPRIFRTSPKSAVRISRQSLSGYLRGLAAWLLFLLLLSAFRPAPSPQFEISNHGYGNGSDYSRPSLCGYSCRSRQSLRGQLRLFVPDLQRLGCDKRIYLLGIEI